MEKNFLLIIRRLSTSNGLFRRSLKSFQLYFKHSVSTLVMRSIAGEAPMIHIISIQARDMDRVFFRGFEKNLFPPQRNDRIHSGGAPSRQVGCQKRNH
jgi:hypothetical protein